MTLDLFGRTQHLIPVSNPIPVPINQYKARLRGIDETSAKVSSGTASGDESVIRENMSDHERSGTAIHLELSFFPTDDLVADVCDLSASKLRPHLIGTSSCLFEERGKSCHCLADLTTRGI